MERHFKQNEYRRIKIITDYSGFDFFLIKKPVQSAIRIPSTVMLDRNGAPKEWIFNSNKQPHHPILKKRRENLLPLTIIKNICSKHISHTSLANFKNISELKQFVTSNLLSRKDSQIFNSKKNLQIKTIDGDILQLSLIEFLQFVGQNKLAEQNFYQKWKMIQQRVSNSKLDECYIIQSVRKNHIIESKSSKYIAVSTGNKVSLERGEDDSFKQASPSKQLEVTDAKTMEAYKFFDTFLNKKFFIAVQSFIESVQKNYKCIVENLSTRFVIDSNRQPHLAAVEQIYVKPITKLFEMKQFTQCIFQGEIKLQNYVRCLQQFLIQNPSRPEPNLLQPLSQQRGYKCKGEFCDAVMLSIPHYAQTRLKLPLITASGNNRKLNQAIIYSVKKRRGRVIQKLKETGTLDFTYHFQLDESSEYESDQELAENVKVCQNCFIFYINVLKFFELDGFGNLIDKRAQSIKSKTGTDESQRKIQFSSVANEDNANLGQLARNKQMNSLKNIKQQLKQSEQITQRKNIKRSNSQHLRLRSLEQHPVASRKKQEESKEKEIPKKIKLGPIEGKNQKMQTKANKLIEAKLSNAKIQGKKKPITYSPIKSVSKNNAKPSNYEGAAIQLIQKLQTLNNQTKQQFIQASKKYYIDNLPQLVDRVSYSSEYLTFLYDFMNNSPLRTAPGNRIKKRPEMNLKRLSQLTNYPQIVSRSTFVFDTLICDERTTIPFCVISSKMIHHNNDPAKPYQNIFVVNDIFDSYIQHISMAKQLLQDSINTRFILFNYPGQSHTIYDKEMPFRTSQFCSILDKLIYRLSAQPNQLNIFTKKDVLKFIGFGIGGFLISSFLSLNISLSPIVPEIALINTGFQINKKYRQNFESLLQLYSVEDQTTEDNAFLFYNKSINSTEIEREQLQDKSGLNSIRVEGRCFLLKNVLEFWEETNHQNFQNYDGKVDLIYSRGNVLLNKSDLQRFMFRSDAEKTTLKNRQIFEVEGGHHIQAQNYQALIKLILQLIN